MGGIVKLTSDSGDINFKTCENANYQDITKEDLISLFEAGFGNPKPNNSRDRATILAENFLRKALRKGNILQDLQTANVSLNDYNKMVIKEKPLGFSDKDEYIRCMEDLMRAIDKSLKGYIDSKISNLGEKINLNQQVDQKKLYKLILTGTSTTFYSENPQKPGNYFDNNKKSDIDIAVRFNPEFREKIIQLLPVEANPSSLSAQQYGMSDTASFLNLYKFYTGPNYDGNGGWGPHDYCGIDKQRDLNNYLVNSNQGSSSLQQQTLIDNSILKREIGVIILKVNEVPSHNSLCDYRFYYPE